MDTIQSLMVADAVAPPALDTSAAAGFGKAGDLMGTEAAQEHYREICEKHCIFANSTFLKQLGCQTAIFVFENDYLGEKGLAAIASTLQRCAVHGLYLPHCRLQSADIQVLCTVFATHPTLESLDLRGNAISLTDAKRILMLLCSNPHITEVLLDTCTPRYVAIQQQCCRNARRPITVGLCASGDSRVVGPPSSADAAGDHFSPACAVLSAMRECFDLSVQRKCTAVELRVFFQLLLEDCEKADGVLLLCSRACAEKLVLDLFACARYALQGCSEEKLGKVRHEPECLFPSHVNSKWRDSTTRLIAKLRVEYSTNASVTVLQDPCPVHDDGLEKILNEELQTARTRPLSKGFCGGSSSGHVCSLCGCVFAATQVSNCASMLLDCLLKDVERVPAAAAALETPSILLRICRVMAQHANLQHCCSRKCLRHVVRFALYGFHGVQRNFSPKIGPSLSSVLPLNRKGLWQLPECTFSVAALSPLRVKNVDEEEICCALTVASAMEDIEDVPIDPYMIYAIGRRLARQPHESIGMMLESACEAVCVVGCVEAAAVPFNRRAGHSPPPRALIADWGRWDQLGVRTSVLLPSAFARRRSGVYAVDGPHSNLFDNVRAALWAFRKQRRAVVVTFKFSAPWLQRKDGVLEESGGDPRGGFYTTVKVLGQTILNNEPRIILQGNFGPRWGHGGYFYMSRGLFNRYSVGRAYIFLERSNFLNLQQDLRLFPVLPCACEVVSPCLRALATLPDGLDALRDMLSFLPRLCLANADGVRLSKEQRRAVESIAARIPLSLIFFGLAMRETSFVAPFSHSTALDAGRGLLENKILPGFTSSWLFLLNEVLGAGVCRWLCHSFQVADRQDVPYRRYSLVAYERLINAGASEACSVIRPGENSHRRWRIVEADDSATQELGPSPSAAMDLYEATTKVALSMAPASHQKLLSTLARDEHNAGGTKRRLRWATEIKERADQHTERCPHSSKQGEERDFFFDTLGKRWRAFQLCNQDGSLSSLAVCFVAGLVCLYDLATSTLVAPLIEVQKFPLFAGGFPFPKDISCAFNHPLRPREVYMFSGSGFIVWDAYEQRCLLGPRLYHDHLRFCNLPEAFKEMTYGGVCSALPLPGTPWVVLFNASEECVIYDLERYEAVSVVQSTHAVAGAKEGAAAAQTAWEVFADETRKALQEKAGGSPSGSRGAVPKGGGGGEGRFSLANDVLSYVLHGGGPLAVLRVAPEEVDQTGTVSATQGIVGAELLLMPLATGEVLSFYGQPVVAHGIIHLSPLKQLSVHQTALCHLPLSLRQMCVEALPTICAAVIEHVVASKSYLICLELYRPHHAEPLEREEASLRSCLPNDAGCGGFISSSAAGVEGGAVFLAGDHPCSGKAAPVVVTAYQWEHTQRTEHRTFPLCFMGFAPPGAACSVGRYAESLREDVFYYHQRCPERVSAADAAPSSIAWVQFDLGQDQLEAFGAVIVVLDGEVKHLGAMGLLTAMSATRERFVVESSEDAVLFRRLSSDFEVRGCVAFASWNQTHVARYWRVGLEKMSVAREATPLTQPPLLGLVRVFWCQATWAPALAALNALQPFVFPLDHPVRVHIAAGQITKSADHLLRLNSSMAVFAAPTRLGWWARRAVLPLVNTEDGQLVATSSALFFCDDCFAEMDLDRSEVVGCRTVALHRHPAFHKLPFPFCAGLDAIFYMDLLEKPGDQVVAMVRDGLLLRWSLREGCARGSVMRWQDVPEFEGIPVNLTDGVFCVANSWRTMDEVLVLFRNESSMQTSVLYWDMKRRALTTGPATLQENPLLHCSELEGKTLHCIFARPNHPSAFFIFAEDLVAYRTTAVAGSGDWCVTAVSLSRVFYRLVYYLPTWGVHRRDAVVTIDLRSQPLLVLGVQLTCQGGDSGCLWSVEYSDDSFRWTAVGKHYQSSSCVRTTWTPSRVQGVSHRFWRLSRAADDEAPGTTALDSDAVFYSNLEFLTLPFEASRALPARLSTNGRVVGATKQLFEGASNGSCVVFENISGLTAESGGEAAYVLLDYGPSAHPELAGVSFVRSVPCADHPGRVTPPRRAPSVSDVWTVSRSTDGVSWQRCGVFATSFDRLTAFWDQDKAGPARFWKLETGTAHDAAFGQFVFFVSRGPSLTLCQPRHVTPTSCLPLLWMNPRSAPTLDLDTDSPAPDEVCYHLATFVGNALVLETRDSPYTGAISGLEVHCAPCTALEVGFHVEYSWDSMEWLSITGCEIHYLQTVFAMYWPFMEDYRFWRLRVMSSSDPRGFLLLTKVQWMTCTHCLYRVYLTTPPPTLSQLELLDPRNAKETAWDDYFYVSLPYPRSLVGVRVTALPPRADYVVEQLDMSGSAWRRVACIRATDALGPINVMKGWRRGSPSLLWRLRRDDGRHGDETSDASPLTSAALLTDAPLLSQQQERPMSVQWLAFAKEEAMVVNVNAIPNGIASAVDLKEVAPLQQITAVDDIAATALCPYKPVLQSVSATEAEEECRSPRPAIRWSFASPVAFHRVHVLARHFFSGVDTADMNATADTLGEKAAVKFSRRASKINSAGRRWAQSDNGKGRASLQKSSRKDTGSASLPVDGMRGTTLSVMVETSHNGVDFVPLAETVFVGNFMSLSWNLQEEGYAYWQIRLCNVPPSVTLEIFQVRWLVLTGVAVNSCHVPHEDSLFTASSIAFNTWQMEAFNHEDAFCKQCRRGFDQAISQDSELRKPDEVQPIGRVAKKIWKMKCQYQKFVTKLLHVNSKNASPSASKLKLPSEGDEQCLDLQCLLLKSAEQYDDSLKHLVELIGQRVKLSDALSFCQNQRRWFYPRFSLNGTLHGKFYGLANLTVSYTVLWSLSLQLQRNTNLLTGACMNGLSPHIASPLVAMYVDTSQWKPRVNFPELLPLHYVGYGGILNRHAKSGASGTIIVFALNEITFSTQYPLTVGSGPTTKSLSSAYPYRVFSGVNFLQHVALASFPPSILDALRLLYPEQFLTEERVLMVLTASSMSTRTAQLRFTLPGEDVLLLHMDDVIINSVEFEIDMTVPERLTALLPRKRCVGFDSVMPGKAMDAGIPCEKASTTAGAEVAVEFNFTFITHGAMYRFSAAPPSPAATLPPELLGVDGFAVGGTPVESVLLPVSLISSLRNAPMPPAVVIRGQMPNGCLPCPYIRDAYITNIFLSAMATLKMPFPSPTGGTSCCTEDSRLIRGDVVLPTGKVYPCSYAVTAGAPWNVSSFIAVDFAESPLDELLAFSEYCHHFPSGGDTAAAHLGGKFREGVHAFVDNMSLSLSVQLVLHTEHRHLEGTGSAKLRGEVCHDLSVMFSQHGFKLSGTLPRISFGPIHIEGCPQEGKPVRLEVMNRDEGAEACEVLLRVFGYSRFITAAAAVPVEVEAGSQGVFLCAGSSRLFDFCVEGGWAQSALPSTWTDLRVQLSLHREPLLEEIRAQLETMPIIVALRAYSLPFSLTLQRLHLEAITLTDSSYSAVGQRTPFYLSLGGIFFGSSFDIFLTWSLPSDSHASLQAMCRVIVGQIMEQCEESLWVSYANIIGCLQVKTDVAGESSPAIANGDINSMSAMERHWMEPQGEFLSRWVEEECQLIETGSSGL